MSLKYTKLEEKNNIAKYKLHTSDGTEANLLRICILKNVDVYKVDYITYDQNESLYVEEKIALRVGQCPIIQDNIEKLLERKNRFYFDVSTGPNQRRWFTTDDIEDIPFYGTHKLSFLQENSRLNGYVELVKGSGKVHTSFMCTDIPVCIKNKDHYILTFESNGWLSCDEIMKRASDMMSYEIIQETTNIFQRPIYSKECIEKYSK